jgi:hypothetical protein
MSEKPSRIIHNFERGAKKAEHRAEYAVDFYAKLHRLEQNSLNMDERIHLMDALMTPVQASGEHVMLSRRAIYLRNRLYETTPISDKMMEMHKAAVDQVLDAIEKDPALKSATANWRRISLGEQAVVVQKVLSLHSVALGIHPPQLDLFHEDPDMGLTLLGGYYDPSRGVMKFNAHAMTRFHYFPALLGVVLHENTHHWQHVMVQELKAGNIAKTDPLYDTLRLFEINCRPGGYNVGSGLNSKDYRNQPIERHAFDVGNYATARASSARKALERLRSKFTRPPRPSPLQPPAGIRFAP